MAPAELVPCFPPFSLAETQQAAVAEFFFFFNSSMHLFFHMTCLRLGYVFKSIISDNH